MKPKRVIVWGHPLHSHTHSYIHAAFVKAFRAMGFETLWMKNGDDVSGLDLPSTLFLTECQVDDGMPKRADCWYVLHNCRGEKYADVPRDRLLTLQVFVKKCLEYAPERVSVASFYKTGGLFQPWATDLLPEEIDLSWASWGRERETHWVGSIGGGEFGNEHELAGFRRWCSEYGIAWHSHHVKTFDENLALVRKSWMAPAIHGHWQVDNGYVACRVFKNISYGALGVTNCPAAQLLMRDMLCCNTDTYAMAEEASSRLDDRPLIREQMAFVREHHTYINRIKAILSVMGLEA